MSAVTIDFDKYKEAVLQLMKSPQIGTDVYTEAARQVSGVPTLTLTHEQRRQLKQAAYGAIYGVSGQTFIEVLKKDPRR